MFRTKLCLSVALSSVFLSPGTAQERRIDEPAQARASGILVFVDAATARSDALAIAAWRAALDRDGWGSWLLVDEWRGARDVRALIQQQARANPSIAGVVLIGDVPQPVLHDVAHLALIPPGAIEGGIASDAYYAELDLEFEQRSLGANQLTTNEFAPAASAPTRFQRDLFVSRIPSRTLQPGQPTTASHILALATRAHAGQKSFRHLIALGRMHESTTTFESWTLASRDLFPALFLPGARLVNVSDEILALRPFQAAPTGTASGLDVLIVRGPRADAATRELWPGLDGPPTVVVFQDTASTGLDALEQNPVGGRAVAFLDGFTVLSSSHFALGLLGHGTSIGACHRRSPFVDASLLGDPTLTFADGTLSRASCDPFDERKLDLDTLDGMLQPASPPVLRALAVGATSERRGAQFASELVRLLKRDPSPLVRFATLEALARTRSDTFAGLLPDAALDPDESVRAPAVCLMGELGRRDHLPRILDRFVRDPSPRVVGEARRALLLFDLTLLTNAVDDFALDCPPGLAFDAAISALNDVVEEARTRIEACIAAIDGPTPYTSERVQRVRGLFDAHVHRAVPALLDAARKPDGDLALRLDAVRALARHAYSAQRAAITTHLRALADDAATPERLRRAARGATERLESGPNVPFLP